ncbi:MAG: hypothetical protein WDW38_004610 [Sanguina aurantia]
MMKRKAAVGVAVSLMEHSDQVEIKPLGAGSEVGRSCIMLHYQGKNVMLDCGIHPGFSGFASLPYLDETNVAEIDVALITHFHLDHCAAVPYLLQKTSFKGRCFMTHPTKAIYHNLLKDFARMSQGGKDEALYSEEDLKASMDKIEVVDFDQTLEVNGIKITAYRAGHVLGAAMFMVEIAGMRCLYTGDYSRVSDRHLPAADLPSPSPNIVIVEATYGVSRHLPREQREARLLQRIHTTVMGGGRVLMPVVALGRAQEILLLLEEYWERNPSLQGVPIYQTSGGMRKAMTVYETYVEMMNDDIKAAFREHNPFEFKHVIHHSTSHFDDVGPCVLMATPSGLQMHDMAQAHLAQKEHTRDRSCRNMLDPSSVPAYPRRVSRPMKSGGLESGCTKARGGVSRDVFEAWCEDSRNAVVVCDYAVSGTLAREILGGARHHPQQLQLKCAVEHISFSAHADFDQTNGFLNDLAPPNVVLVHGEAVEMGRLKAALERSAAALNLPRTVHTPKNNQVVQITHKPARLARLYGRLAERPLKEGQVLRGVLVRDGTHADQILDPEDLPAYTKLFRGRVTQQQVVAVSSPWTDVRLALEVMFEGVEGSGHLPVLTSSPSGEGGSGKEAPAVTVGGIVTVTHQAADPASGSCAGVHIEWEGGRVGDMVADAVIAVLLQSAGESPTASAADVARRAALQGGDPGAVLATELRLVAALMSCQYGPAVVDDVNGVVNVSASTDSPQLRKKR